MCHRIVSVGAISDILVAAQNTAPALIHFEATRCLANISSIGMTLLLFIIYYPLSYLEYQPTDSTPTSMFR